MLVCVAALAASVVLPTSQALAIDITVTSPVEGGNTIKSGSTITVSGGTSNPAAYRVQVQGDWMPMPVDAAVQSNGDYTKDITAPTVTAQEPHTITIVARVNSNNKLGSKTITIVVDP